MSLDFMFALALFNTWNSEVSQFGVNTWNSEVYQFANDNILFT